MSDSTPPPADDTALDSRFASAGGEPTAPLSDQGSTPVVAASAAPSSPVTVPDLERAAPEMVVGNYRVVRVLGEGGMGKVYAAEHRLLGRPAAIKVLLPQYASHTEVVNRFFNEARAAAAAKNAGIVEIYDFGYQDDGSAFIAMEFLEGEDLSQRLRRIGRIPMAQALLFTSQIASALGAAHSSGIVHRDLKPANVFIVSDPQVVGGERIKILDFGIAKVSMTEAGEAEDLPDSKTKVGSVMGTPSYMAPEQCRGADTVDARADLYSVGCILFEMLCGRTPFEGASSVEVMSGHLRDQPPLPSSLEPRIGRDLDALIMSLLAKQPEARFQRAVDLERALHMLLSGSPEGVVVPVAMSGMDAPRSWYRRPAVLASVILAMAVGGVVLGLVQASEKQGHRGPAEARAELPVLTPADAQPAPESASGRAPAFFPAGRDGAEPAQVEAARADPERVVWRITTQPGGAQVRRDGELVGTTATPLFVVVDREAGHNERLELTLFGHVERYLDIDAGEDRELAIDLVEQVKLTLRSRPAGAIIYGADGQPYGPTPGVVMAPPGDQPLGFVLRLDGYADEQVEVVPDETKTTKVTLTPLVTVRIDSEPPGAEVWRDGERLGVTPFEDRVRKQREAVPYQLRLAGYEDQEVSVRARRDAHETVTLRASGGVAGE
ncbi:serine/threonine-protein kinase [Haliangium sp.]|uniref:serine/threonine-protein kinase n=1 Tax=Haliangium sp. TaxID=2663208 RepID=UPI003D0F4FD0